MLCGCFLWVFRLFCNSVGMVHGSVMNFGDDSIVLQCQRVGRACKSEGLLRTHNFLSSQCPVHLPGRFCITSSGDLCDHCLTMRHVVTALGSTARSLVPSAYPSVPSNNVCLFSVMEHQLFLGPGQICLCQQQGNTSEALLKGKIGCGWLEGQGSGFKSRSLLF